MPSQVGYACRPKELGGLGFHDLKHFEWALRQRWLWYQWNDDSNSWQGLVLPCDEKDKSLFRASTLITLDNGKNALLWQDNWLHGKASKDIAPLLYNLAHFKNRTVEKELQNNKWIQGVRRISTRDELLQFIELWSLIRNVSLDSAVRDQIQRKWTPNVEYTTTSAYKIQFQGSHAPFQIVNLWNAKVEPKVKVFACTAMHKRFPTADNLAARGMQHNPTCPLCGNYSEDTEHILFGCSFSKKVLKLLWD
jgi:hypothetical protein